MTCLDTDFVIDLLRRKPAAERKLEDLMVEGDKLTTTPLNASELYKGQRRVLVMSLFLFPSIPTIETCD